jgi:biotin transporter BioY
VSQPSTFARVFVYGLFFVILIGALWVPFYNRLEPSWHGIPFFYWFQIGWIAVTAVATVVAYRLKV